MPTTEAPADGTPIDPSDIADALTRAPFAYADGARQIFTADGHTVYTDNGTQSSGKWKVDEHGRFQSAWPPSGYSTYDLSWIFGLDGEVQGIRFADSRQGTTFDGRYAPGVA